MKIFDVSFSKTGTTSLATAMQILGFKSCHNCPIEYSKDFMDKIVRGRFDLDVINDHDFIGNLLFQFYPILDSPDSKFILLQRNENDWIKSMSSQTQRVLDKFPTKLNVLTFNRIVNINCITSGNNDWLLFKFRQHNKSVLEYFKDKMDRLLVMDIQEGWSPLCKFLEKPIPETSFPHLNQSLNKKRIL